MMRVSRVLACAVAAACGAAVRADVVTLLPVGDAFVSSAMPDNNFGGAGALCVAAPGLDEGEFQSVLRFDTTAAVAGFNSSFGPGHWTIQSVSLSVTAANPNNGIFNPQAAGQFGVQWMQNDSWIEGTGSPRSPDTAGLTFTTLPSFLSASDEAVGTFNFGGNTTGANAYSLSLTSGFTVDMSAGGLVSLHLSAADSSIAYVFHAVNYGTFLARPRLSITVVPGPGAGWMMMGAGVVAARRKRR